MKKLIISFFIVTALLVCIVSAQETISYTVQAGDSMWKIAEKYQVGVSEIISSNSQIKNSNLIYPGQKLTIPTMKSIKS